MGFLDSLVKSAINTVKYSVSSEINSEIRSGIHATKNKIKDGIKKAEEDQQDKTKPYHTSPSKHADVTIDETILPGHIAAAVDENGKYAPEKDLSQRMARNGITEESVSELQEKYRDLFGDDPESISPDSKFAKMSDTERYKALKDMSLAVGDKEFMAFGAFMGRESERYKYAGDYERAATGAFREQQAYEAARVLKTYGQQDSAEDP